MNGVELVVVLRTIAVTFSPLRPTNDSSHSCLWCTTRPKPWSTQGDWFHWSVVINLVRQPCESLHHTELHILETLQSTRNVTLKFYKKGYKKQIILKRSSSASHSTGNGWISWESSNEILVNLDGKHSRVKIVIRLCFLITNQNVHKYYFRLIWYKAWVMEYWLKIEITTGWN